MLRLPSIFRRHRRVEDPAATPGRAVVPLTEVFANLRAISAGDLATFERCTAEFAARVTPPVTASPSARPVPLETRQRLVRFRGYLREHMISEPSRHDAR